MRRKLLIIAAGVGTALMHTASVALAQEGGPSPVGRNRTQFGDEFGFVSTLLFGLIGIVLSIVGFKLFDLLIKHDIEKEVFDNKNSAAAILSAAVVLGVSLIVAATILS